MENVDAFLDSSFVVICLLTVWLFYRATGENKKVSWIIMGWALVQLFLSLTGFYTNTTSPLRFGLLALPAMLFVASLFILPRGKAFLDSLDSKKLTILHIIRIPVEIVLYSLFIAKAIPEDMTFTGNNFDILAGLTAPLVYYLYFMKQTMSKKIFLAWNIFSVLLLLNIVVTAIFSLQSPFQQFGFEQPNVVILHFPYVWLPSVVVPIVFLSHFATIRQILKKK